MVRPSLSWRLTLAHGDGDPAASGRGVRAASERCATAQSPSASEEPNVHLRLELATQPETRRPTATSDADAGAAAAAAARSDGLAETAAPRFPP